jgi:hypothetical protein
LNWSTFGLEDKHGGSWMSTNEESLKLLQDEIENSFSPNWSAKEIAEFILNIAKNYNTQFKKELIGENDESLDRILREYSACVARNSWKIAQRWCKWSENEDGAVLMPDYTRLYYRKGTTEVVVQEFPPQIRLMKFKGKLCQRSDSGETINADVANRTYSYSLALPYSIFIFKFRDGMFSHVHCAFSDRPLRNLGERPLIPYLSNIDSTLKVCLGSSFSDDKLQTGNIVQQCSYVLDHFWHSTYSDEWSGHFWSSKKHFINTGDSRMVDMLSWQEASTENPLFVVEDVNWLKYQEESFGDMLVRLFDDDRNVMSFQQELYNTLTEEFLNEIKSSLEQNMNRVEELVSKSAATVISKIIRAI